MKGKHVESKITKALKWTEKKGDRGKDSKDTMSSWNTFSHILTDFCVFGWTQGCMQIQICMH